MKDYFPQEVQKINQIELIFRECVKKWGYKEIRTPTIEFIDTLTMNVGNRMVKDLFVFQDSSGDLLALRPDITTSIARAIACKKLLKNKKTPLRFSYLGSVFRNISTNGLNAKREFQQIGIELIGDASIRADTEVLAVIVDLLKELGLNEIRIDLGYSKLLQELIAQTTITADEEKAFLMYLFRRDYASVNSFMKEKNFSPILERIFSRLISVRDLSNLLTIQFPETENISNCLVELQDLLKYLQYYDIDDYVFFDISLTRDLDYYTGIICEVSTPQTGIILGGGGRYDRLIEKFGNGKIPATGFAFNLSNCLKALNSIEQDLCLDSKPIFLVLSNDDLLSIKISNRIREKNFTAVFSSLPSLSTKQLTNEFQQDFDYLVLVKSSDEPLILLSTETNQSQKLSIEQLLEKVGGNEL
jgi:ATP phosphoribosyltransferase regulatory subunit